MVVGSLASCTAAVAAVVSRSGAVLPSQVKVSAVVAVRRRFVVVVRGAAMVVRNGGANGGRWWWLP